MKRYDKVTPDGTRDLLFDECVSRAQVAGRLTSMFRSRGYRVVITPSIRPVLLGSGALPAGDDV